MECGLGGQGVFVVVFGVFVFFVFCFVFFFKQKTAYEISACLVGSEMCVGGSPGPAGTSWSIHLGCSHIPGAQASYCAFGENSVSRKWVVHSRRGAKASRATSNRGHWTAQSGRGQARRGLTDCAVKSHSTVPRRYPPCPWGRRGGHFSPSGPRPY